MAERTLEQRVAALEKQMGDKTLQEHFREHAELVDRLLVYRFDEFEKKLDAKWDARLDVKLAAFEERLDAKWEKRFDEKFEQKFEEKFEQKFELKFEQKFSPVRAQLANIETAVMTILSRLS